MTEAHDRQAVLNGRGVYAIIDPAQCRGRDPVWVAERALAGGCRALQLRGKNASESELERVGRALLGHCRAASVPFVVNDSPALALRLGADGVHLGQSDLPIEAARALLGPSVSIGISTHNLEQAVEAMARGADAIGFGPVFATDTKPDAEAVVGLESLGETCRAVELPVIAIGGISELNVAAVAARGATMAAAIRAICAADDPAEAVRRLARPFAT